MKGDSFLLQDLPIWVLTIWPKSIPYNYTRAGYKQTHCASVLSPTRNQQEGIAVSLYYNNPLKIVKHFFQKKGKHPVIVRH
jgi:hypothetical protein